jgi:nicotinamidase-related amidase
MPKVLRAVEEARAKGVAVVHSTVRGAKPEDVKQGFAPKAGEPVVQAPADKYVGTELEKMLKDKGVQTVIVTGTAAHGAVLYTSSGSIYRGFKVIVPVDGMSSESTFYEQYVAHQLMNLPGAPQGAMTLTRLDMIKY